MTKEFTNGHPQRIPACNFLSQYYFFNIFLQKSRRFSFQFLAKFEATKTGSGVGCLRLTAVGSAYTYTCPLNWCGARGRRTGGETGLKWMNYLCLDSVVFDRWKLVGPCIPDRIWIWKCWLLRREENRRTRRKTPGESTRTNNKLNPHMTAGPGIEPRSHWWEASALTTTPSLLPYQSNKLADRSCFPCLRLRLRLRVNQPLRVTIKECLVSWKEKLANQPNLSWYERSG